MKQQVKPRPGPRFLNMAALQRRKNVGKKWEVDVDDLPYTTTADTTPSRTYPNDTYMHCGQTKKLSSVTDNTVSIQDLQAPLETAEKLGRDLNVFRVQNDEFRMQEIKSSSEKIESQGNVFSSTTNSHFASMVCPVKSTKPKVKNVVKKERPSYQRRSTKTTVNDTIESTYSSDTSRGIDPHFSKKPRDFNGPEWKKPCKGSFQAGKPAKYIGTCPRDYEKLSKFSPGRQKFFLTQDPRKSQCLVNPASLKAKEYSRDKKFEIAGKMVKYAQNTCATSRSETSESFICEVIDLENPLNLDFQGMDYKNTYQTDEQEFQNQRVYRKVCRFLERKRTKADIATKIQEQEHMERVCVPDRYEIRDRAVVPPVIPPEPPEKLGKLYRAIDKPRNKAQIEEERETRFERYKDLYYRNRDRERQRELKAKKDQKYREEYLGLVLAEEHLGGARKQIEECIKRTYTNELILHQPKVQRRVFPHTMHETRTFKRYLKARNVLKRDEAIARKEFYKERLNKDKHYPEIDLEISSESEQRPDESAHSEESTDDADDLDVGIDEGVFKLRGFHFFLNDHMRGKFTEREKHRGRHERGCMTREEWLKQLAPKKETVKVDIEMGILKHVDPDDPNLVLFPPVCGYKVSRHKQSAIRQYEKKPLGRHYDRLLRKRLKFIKPRLTYNVKKFNLIDYRFGDTTKRLGEIRDEITQGTSKQVGLSSTNAYMMAKMEKERRRLAEIKEKRLKLLGIPCVTIKRSRLQTKCENSESSSGSEWVPEHEGDYNDDDEENLRKDPNLIDIVPLKLRGNMPAPPFREPTLRQHPRRGRDYDKNRVPSNLFDKTVRDTHIPHLHKLNEDVLQYANVGLRKRPYTKMFTARHHHDHWNPTQTKYVDVHYQPKVVKAETTKLRRKQRISVEKFKEANPPCNQFVHMDLTIPNYDFEAMIREQQELMKARKSVEEVVEEEDTPEVECRQEKFVLRSRDPEELAAVDYPGRQKFLKFLEDVKISLYSRRDGHHHGTTNQFEDIKFNRDLYYKELEEDLESIESCLTSFSSSQCTNFTNDSGSFLLMEGKEKVPLDYIRKSLVPFEELQRSRFTAEPIDVHKNEANPWTVMPFSGQKKAQELVTMPSDSFFTFNTRLKNGLRLRLEVPIEDVRNKYLGSRFHKYKSMVAIDIDENYVSEMRNRPPVKCFKFKSGRTIVKDALRMKFESLLIQGQIVRTKIYDRLNEQYWKDMQEVKVLYDRLFAKWEKREYESSMAVVYKVKSFYDETDRLKTRFRVLERDMLILNMDIVFIEGHWIRCIMLQNFHYLMGDFQWRARNDWIHGSFNALTQSYELEDFGTSIQRRSFVNVRERDKDDAWAIKQFYEECYLPNQRPILVVFSHADIFLEGIMNLKSKTFVLLLELHFTMALYSDLKFKLDTFEIWCRRDLSEKEAYVDRKCSKLYFMENRASWLKKRTLTFIGKPIDVSFDNDTFHHDRASIMEVWRRVVPSNMRVTSEMNMKAVDMVAMISDIVMDLISKFERFPMKLSQAVEVQYRRRMAYLRKQSFQAFQIEKRIDMEMRKVVRNLEPPYVKPRRIGRLPRLLIKKRDKTVPPPEKKISERTKFFFRAFHEDGEAMHAFDVREGLAQIDTMQEQIVPFYFDHFLKLNGYTPNYNFKTHVEQRDGPEVDRIKITALLPEVMQRLENWEEKKKKTMEDHITQNPKMYIDVI